MSKSISKKTIRAAKLDMMHRANEDTDMLCDVRSSYQERQSALASARLAARGMRPRPKSPSINDETFNTVAENNKKKRQGLTTSFNYGEGSLVEIRKSFSYYGSSRYISVEKGIIAMVVRGPYEVFGGMAADILVSGTTIENVNPKHLVAYENE